MYFPPGRPRAVFVSYSRKDYYSAEAVHARLRDNPSIDPWMDVSRLRLGEDWAEAIGTAISRSDVFVLIQSPHSATSENVRAECSIAVRWNVPIAVAIISGSTTHLDRVPPVGVFDLRSDFDGTVEEMCRAIGSGTIGRADRGTTGFGARPPWPLVAVLACLAMNIGYLLLALTVSLHGLDAPARTSSTVRTVTYTPFGKFGIELTGVASLGSIALTVLTLSLIVRDGHRLIRRQVNARRFALEQILPPVALVLAGVVATDLTLARVDVASSAQFLGRYAVPLVVAMVLTSLVAVLTVANSEALMRYTKLGCGFVRVRRKITRHEPDLDEDLSVFLGSLNIAEDELESAVSRVRSIEAMPPDPTYSMLYEDDDAQVAEIVRRGCTAAGVRECPGGRWTILILSNVSRLSAVEEFVRAHPRRSICVLTTRVDVDEETTQVRRLQWLDFRERSVASLATLLAGMRNPGRILGRLPVPMDPRNFRAPESVTQTVTNLSVLSGATAGTAIGLLLRPELSVVAAGLAAVTTAWFLVLTPLAVSITRRRCTRNRCRRDLIISLGLALLFVSTAATQLDRLPAIALFAILLIEVFVTHMTFSSLERGGWLLHHGPAQDAFHDLDGIADEIPALLAFACIFLSLVLGITVIPS